LILGIFQDFVIKIKNTFSSDDENDLSTTMPYSLLPFFKKIKEEIQETFDSESPDFDFFKIEIKLSEDSVSWNAIIQCLTEEEEPSYKKISKVEGIVTKETARLPFGFQPFSSVKNDAIDALKIAKRKEDLHCFRCSLYFPLSPFDTEPLWFLYFENEKQAIVGADTGSLEVKDV
jgi:hypothetical protein